jgi:polysaccharide biosynthesis transport protein
MTDNQDQKQLPQLRRLMDAVGVPQAPRPSIATGDGAGTPVRQAEAIYRDAAPATQVDDMGATSGLVEYWKVVVRHRGTVLLLLILGAVAGFLFTLPQTPIYRAHATMEIQGLNENFLDMKNFSPTATVSTDPTTDILTQVQLLESQSLRERTVAKLTADRPADALVSYAPDRLAAWKAALHLDPSKPLTWEDAVGMAAGSLTIRASGTTRIIDVAAESPSPNIAASVANGLVNEFIDEDLAGRLTTSEQTSQWLSQQLDDLKIKLEKSEDGLQAYALAAGLQITSSTSKDGATENAADQKLKQLQTEMLNAQAERVKAQSRYELISSAPIDSLPQVVDDAGLREYQTRLVELRRSLAELSVVLTSENPKVQKVQGQINEVQNALSKERTNIVGRIKNDYEAADRRERLLAEEYGGQLKLVNDQGGKEIHYDILKREADTNRQIYEAMLQRVKEAGIASALRASNYRVVDPAKPPGGPYKPNLSQSATLGSFGGLVVGILFVLVRERADRSLQQPGDAPRYLNIPELGIIPSDRLRGAVRLHGDRSRLSIAAPGNGSLADVALATFKRKPSILAESFHDTLTSILFSGQNGHRPQVIALCSAGPAEGKTTVASNLAAALADINLKVLLIDADMRRPRLHHIFDVPNDEGLGTLLKGSSPILSRPKPPLVVETEVQGLCLMPSGHAKANPSNLLYSPRLAELIRAVRGEFNYILFDTPPMLQLADARILSQHCDTAILVFRAGKTTRDAARAALLRFQQDGTPVLGTILNDWHPGHNGYGFDSKYYDRYAKYYNVKQD